MVEEDNFCKADDSETLFKIKDLCALYIASNT